MKEFLGEMFNFAPNLLNIWYHWYHIYSWQNIGKIKNKKPSAKQFITFADVEGVDAAKAELLEVIY